jgi:hypothetical protein
MTRRPKPRRAPAPASEDALRGVKKRDRVRVVDGPRRGVEGVASTIFPSGPGRPEPRAMISDAAGTFPSVPLSLLVIIEAAL